jgi:hypothetical protein
MMTKGLFQPLVLAGFLATGFLIVWGVVAVWALQSYLADECQRGKLLLFQADGTPLVAQFDYRYGENQYWDLQGNPVPLPDRENPTMALGSSLPCSLTDRANTGETDWEQRIRSFSDGGSPPVYWYYVSDGQSNGSGYFVGYDSKSCGCVGYMGTAGFRTDGLPTEELIPCGHARAQQLRREDVLTVQYDLAPTAVPYGYTSSTAGRAPRGYVSPCDVYIVGRDRKIYHADLQKRTVHVALEDSQLCSAALVLGMPDPVQGTPHRLVARIEDTILVLDDRGQILKRYPIPESLRSLDIHFGETTAGEALMYWTSPFDELSTKVDYRIYWVAPNGSFRQTEITLPSYSELPALQTFGAVVVPAPLVLGGFLATYGPWLFRQEGLALTYEAALSRMLTDFWPALMIAQLLAAGLAVLCYRRQVRYRASQSERAVWPLFVLALGLPGWVAYRFGRSWPVLESCPACGVGVPQDREDCARCEADFPGPMLKGTEVFA